MLLDMLQKDFHACCKSHLTGIISESNPDHAYITILNRGGLTIPSTSLTDYVCTSFAILSFTKNSVIKSNIRARKAAEIVLSHTFGIYQDFTCNDHRALGQTFVNQIISNIFFNNKRKATTSSVHKDNVVSFKKRQREKELCYNKMAIFISTHLKDIINGFCVYI